MTIFLFILINSNSTFALDLGDGSDGTCTLSGALDTSTKATYNCTSLSITSAVTVTGNSLLTIKIQGSALISGTGSISLNGGNGNAGNAAAPNFGGIAGAGAFAGGGCPVDEFCDGNLKGDDGSDGGTTSKGIGGNHGNNAIGGPSGGGGGGGARYSDYILPTAGADTVNDLPSAVLGGPAGSLSYLPESNFENSIAGGSGGGSGGSGETGGSVIHSGGSGGGGGGILSISAGGDIVVSTGASIVSNGGSGGAGSGAVSGGGGGGSGGAIFFRALGDIRNNGSVSALGGNGGDGTFAADDNDGGNGGSGRIRFDDGDGIITGTGSATPSSINNVVTSIQFQTYNSDIKCGVLGMKDRNDIFNMFSSLMLLFLIIYVISKRKIQILNL